MSRELLRQALEALEWLLANIRRNAPELSGKAMGTAEDAIAALRSALEAPEPEPYGHVTTHTVTGQQFFYRYPSPPYLDNAKECIVVYAAPPAAPAPATPARVPEPLPEPVQRLLRFAGKKRSEVSNPCLTAREAIVIADWMQAHGITGGSK